MEACIKCKNEQNKYTKKQIKKELNAFLKNPENFIVIFNPRTGFYKLQQIEEK